MDHTAHKASLANVFNFSLRLQMAAFAAAVAQEKSPDFDDMALAEKCNTFAKDLTGVPLLNPDGTIITEPPSDNTAKQAKAPKGKK